MSPFQRAIKQIRKNRAAMFSVYWMILLLILLIFGPWMSFVADPNHQNLSEALQNCSLVHFFGTDHLGRDMFSRVLYGGRISLLVGFVATIVTLIIGVFWGGISGYVGGKIDALMMRIIDILFALPFLVLVILFSLKLNSLTEYLQENEILNLPRNSPYLTLIPLFMAIGAIGWLTIARMVRSQVKALISLEFIDAAKILGLSDARIFFRHMIPNMLGPIIVQTTLAIPNIMLLEALLSFLGLGIKAPDSSWGTLIKEGVDRFEVAPWMLIFPAIAFCFTLLALNFIGDGLRDVFDPREN